MGRKLYPLAMKSPKRHRSEGHGRLPNVSVCGAVNTVLKATGACRVFPFLFCQRLFRSVVAQPPWHSTKYNRNKKKWEAKLPVVRPSGYTEVFRAMAKIQWGFRHIRRPARELIMAKSGIDVIPWDFQPERCVQCFTESRGSLHWFPRVSRPLVPPIMCE